MKEFVVGTVHLENFKTFSGKHSFRFDEEPGLYFVMGENKDDPQLGANGTGKSTLLADALMWVFYDKTIRDTRPADAITSWAKGKARTEVSVDLKRGADKIIVTRTRRPNSLTIGVNDTQTRTIDQAELERTLGMNEDMFKRTIVLGQFGSLFLDMKPEAQSQMFTDALGLDIWLRAADEAGKDVKAQRRKVDVASSELDRANARITEALDSLTRAKDAAAGWADKHAEAVRVAKADLASHEDRLKKFKADAPAGGGKKAGPALDSLKDEIDGVRRALRTAGRDNADALAVFRGAEQKLKDERNNLARYEKAAEDRKCPDCGQTVSQKHLREKVDGIRELIKAAEGKLEEARENEEVRAKDVKRIEALVDEKEKLLRAAEDADRLRREWNTRLVAYQRNVEVADDKVVDLEKETNPHSDTIKQIEARVDDLEVEEKSAATTKAEEEELLEAANYWVDAFRDIRLKRLEEALSELEMVTTRYAESLGLEDWRIEFATERETKSGATSLGFSVSLYPPGESVPVRWASYCGGEVQRWQLAVAFALSEILLARAGLSPNMEVFDEPTRGLSPQGVATLIEQLRERALDQGKAIYLVDHHALDTGLFDGTLKVSKKNGTSTFKWQ